MKKFILYIFVSIFYLLFANDKVMFSYNFNNLNYTLDFNKLEHIIDGKHKIYANIFPKKFGKNIEYNENILLKDKEIFLKSKDKVSFVYELNSSIYNTPYFKVKYKNLNQTTPPLIEYAFNLSDSKKSSKFVYSNESVKSLNLMWDLDLTKVEYIPKSKIYVLKRLFGLSFDEKWQFTQLQFTDLAQRRFYQEITKENFLKIYVKSGEVLNNITFGISRDKSRRVKENRNLEIDYFQKSTQGETDIYTLDFKKFLDNYYRGEEKINLVEFQLFVKKNKLNDVKKIEFLKSKSGLKILEEHNGNEVIHSVNLKELNLHHNKINSIQMKISNNDTNLKFVNILEAKLFDIDESGEPIFFTENFNKLNNYFKLNDRDNWAFEKFNIDFDSNITQLLNLTISPKDLLVIKSNVIDENSIIKLNNFKIAIKQNEIKVPLSLMKDKKLLKIETILNKKIRGEISILSSTNIANIFNKNVYYMPTKIKTIELNNSIIYGNQILDKSLNSLKIFTEKFKWNKDIEIEIPLNLKNIHLKNISFNLDIPPFIDKNLIIRLGINNKFFDFKLTNLNNYIEKVLNFRGDLKKLSLKIPTQKFYNQNYLKLFDLKLVYKELNSNLKDIIVKDSIVNLNSKKFFINENFEYNILREGGGIYLGKIDLNSTNLKTNFNVSKLFDIGYLVLKPDFNLSQEEFLSLLKLKNTTSNKLEDNTSFDLYKIFKLLIGLFFMALILKNRKVLFNLLKTFMLSIKNFIENFLIFTIKVLTLNRLKLLSIKVKSFIFGLFYISIAIYLYIKFLFSTGINTNSYYINFAGIIVVVSISYFSIFMKKFLTNFKFGEKIYQTEGSIYFLWSAILLIIVATLVAINMELIAKQISVIIYYLLVWGVFKEFINLRKFS